MQKNTFVTVGGTVYEETPFIWFVTNTHFLKQVVRSTNHLSPKNLLRNLSCLFLAAVTRQLLSRRFHSFNLDVRSSALDFVSPRS